MKQVVHAQSCCQQGLATRWQALGRTQVPCAIAQHLSACSTGAMVSSHGVVDPPWLLQDQYVDCAPTPEDTEQALSEMVEACQLVVITSEAGPSYTLTHAMSEAVAKEDSSALRLVGHLISSI